MFWAGHTVACYWFTPGIVDGSRECFSLVQTLNEMSLSSLTKDEIWRYFTTEESGKMNP